MKLLIKNALAYIEGDFLLKDILIENGKIVAFGKPCCSFERIEEIDLGGSYLVPGFIDIHTHGACGVDVNKADADGFEKMASFFASQGVSAFLASVLTDSKENTQKILNQAVRYKMHSHAGAEMLGVHLEGPFLSVEKKGAMPECYLSAADLILAQEYLDSGVVKYITVAPEINGGIELIQALSRKTGVAIGHSAASYLTALKAIHSGAISSTHTFNAMAGLDRVEPGILGAVLDTPVYNEIIADGHHVHPANIRLLYCLKGNKKLIAITDSIEATGMPEGEYMLGCNKVSVKNGEAFLSGSHARAGSVLTMQEALRNMIQFLDISLQEALPMFCENAADMLHLNKGYIRLGYDADFAVLDKSFSVQQTFVAGKRVYIREENRNE